MNFPKFVAGLAISLSLAVSAAPAGAAAVVEAPPYGAGPGWWGYPRPPGGIPYPPRYAGPSPGLQSFYWEPYWSGEQQVHTAPHK